ncbi:hypothetical protein SLS57_000019 [Botryosphaeria dothidea]
MTSPASLQKAQEKSFTMPALDLANLLSAGPSVQAHRLVKRKNWAAREAGVVTVFCIVGAIAILLISLFAWKKFQKRRLAKAG